MQIGKTSEGTGYACAYSYITYIELHGRDREQSKEVYVCILTMAVNGVSNLPHLHITYTCLHTHRHSSPYLVRESISCNGSCHESVRGQH